MHSKMSYYYWRSFDRGPLNQGKVGELNVKPTSHWERVEAKYWSSTCGLVIRPDHAHYTNKQVALRDIREAKDVPTLFREEGYAWDTVQGRKAVVIKEEFASGMVPR